MQCQNNPKNVFLTGKIHLMSCVSFALPQILETAAYVLLKDYE